MPHVLIIGLPNSMRQFAQTQIERHEVIPTILPCDLNRRGDFVLVPSEEDAIHRLYHYCDELVESYEHAEILVLPYARFKPSLQSQLETLESMNAKVRYVGGPESSWPQIQARQKPDNRFYQNVLKCLIEELIGVDPDEPPSVYVREIVEACPNLIIVDDAIELCDDVAPHRFTFIRDCIDAFAELIELNGGNGRKDAFFRSKNLHHAQSGGIAIKLSITVDGDDLGTHVVHSHLSKGQKTTAAAAPRVYYHDLYHSDQLYIFLLYLGPHPEDDLTRAYDLLTAETAV